jgi:DHA1 family bicyclomycin/chloramphenicol resistance-like MFS transporter
MGKSKGGLAGSRAGTTSTTVPDQPSKRLTKPVIILAASVTCLGIFSTDSFISAMPAIAESFDSSIARAEAGLASAMLGYGIAPLFFGMAADRFGRKIPLLMGIGLFLLASLLTLFAPSTAWIVACRFLQGLGGACVGLGRAIGRDVFSGASLTRFMALCGILGAIASSLGSLLGSNMVAWFGWTGVFWLHAGYALLMLALLAIFLPETLAVPHRQRVAWRDQLHHMRRICSHRRARGAAILSSGGVGGAIAFTAHLPFWLKDLGVSTAGYGIYAMTLPLGYLIGNIVCEFGPIKPQAHLLRIGLAIILITTGLLGFAYWAGTLTPWMLVLLGSSYMAGNGFLLPVTGAEVMRPFPDCAGVASALYSLAMMGVATMTILLLGQLTNGSNLPILMAMLGIPCIAYLYNWWCCR